MSCNRTIPSHLWDLFSIVTAGNILPLTCDASEHIQGCTAMAQLLCGVAHLSPDPPSVQGDDNEAILLYVIC